MFNNLSALALGIVTFAITIGVGTVVLLRFAGSQADCPTGSTFNYTQELCANTADSTNTTTPTNNGFSIPNALMGDLGSSGLAGWAAAIIALVVGLLFIGALMGRKRNY